MAALGNIAGPATPLDGVKLSGAVSSGDAAIEGMRDVPDHAY